MQEVLDKILERHAELFGDKPQVRRVEAGFTNTLYYVNDAYIVKICTSRENEANFAKEIDFYKANEDNVLIPKLYFASTDKRDVPYFYEIIEKVSRVTLYEVWHTLSEEQREDMIRQLCVAMKEIHRHKVEKYDWAEKMKGDFVAAYAEAKKLGLFNADERNLLDEAYAKFDKFLESDEKDFVLVHNDLHFDNIFYDQGKTRLIDFERAIAAPRDFELDILYRMVRKLWTYTNLRQRLATYDLVYFLTQLIEYPKSAELKNDVLRAAEKVLA